MAFIPIHNYLLVITLVIGIYASVKAKGGFERLLLLYLVLTVIIETIGLISWKIFRLSNNSPVYNFYISAQGVFIFLIYSKMYTTDKFKSLAKMVMVPFIMFGALNLFLLQGIMKFNTHTIILLSIFVIVLAFFYYYELIKSESSEKIFLISFFWVNTGFFLFFLAMLFYWGTWEYLIIKKIDYKGKLFLMINQVANFVIYTCISIGFLCKKAT